MFICYDNIQQEINKYLEKLEDAKLKLSLKNEWVYAWKKEGIECSCQRENIEQDTNI